MPIKTRELKSKLQSKFGFSPSTVRSDDHSWYELKIPGLPIIATKVSHGSKEISRGLENAIARQLRVRKNFFHDMIGCTKDSDTYQKQVRDDPYPPFNVHF